MFDVIGAARAVRSPLPLAGEGRGAGRGSAGLWRFPALRRCALAPTLSPQAGEVDTADAARLRLNQH